MRNIGFILGLVLAALSSSSAFGATVKVVPATGGTEISSDSAANGPNPAWTTLGSIRLFEKNRGHQTSFVPGTNVTLVLRLPANFEFNQALTPSLDFTQNRDIASASVAITSSNTLTLTLTVTGLDAVDSLEIGATGMQVRPVATFPLGNGIIHRPAGNLGGTATIRGIKGSADSSGTDYNATSFGTLTQIAGDATGLAMHIQPSAMAISGVPFGRQPVVSVVDQHGNVRTSENGRIVTVDIGTGSGTLSGTTSATVVDGYATFSDIAATQGGIITLQFSSLGLTNVSSWPIAVDTVAQTSVATSLAFVTVPSTSADAGVAFAQQPVIKVTDQYDFVVTNDNITMVTAARSAGQGLLQGDVAQQAVNGIVTFTNLSHNVANDITVLFSALNINPVVSSTIRISPSLATHLVFATSPNDAEVGLPFGTQPVVVTQDAYGNPSITGLASNVVVSVALTSGAGPLTGLTSLDIGTEDGNGQIDFTDLAIGTAGTDKQLTASAVGFTNGLSSVFTVHGADQVITFDPLADKVYGDAPFEVSATASSGLPVSFSIANGPAFISSNVVTIIGAGSVTVRASQEGNTDYDPAPHVDQTFNVSKGDQTITFPAIGNKLATDLPFAVAASASSGLSVTLEVVTGPATLVGNLVTLTGTGDVTLRATQTGNENYNAADAVEQTFSVSKASQTISFGSLANKTYGDAPFQVSASASSSLPVSFSVISGPVTIDGNTVTITGTGSATIRASQAGNSSYSAATPIDQTFQVNKASQTIVFAPLDDKVYGDAPFAVSATASSGLPVTLSVQSGPATLADGVVTITGAGSVTIQAVQAGDTNYNAAPNIDRTFAVAKASQTITFERPADKTYGDEPFTLSATASSGLAPSFELVSGPGTLTNNVVTITGVGEITIRCVQAGDGNREAATPVEHSILVAKAALGVKVDDAIRLFGAENPEFTGTINGLVYDDNITATYETIADTNSAPGEYAITPSFNDPDDRLKNYEASITNGVLTVLMLAPTILDQPTNLKTNQGANVTFTVNALGMQLNYQWVSNGVQIAGATNSMLQITNARTTDSGIYEILVSNSGGAVTSVVCNLNVFFIPADLDENGQAEIVLKHLDGRVACWYMDGTNFVGKAILRDGKSVSTPWRIAGQNDFNGDKQTDILFHHDDGRLALWIMNGTNVQQVVPMGATKVDWRARGLHDMDGDGDTDILLQCTDGRIGVRYLNGTNTSHSGVLRDNKALPAGWRIAGVRDFDGDEDGDILLQNRDGRIAVWIMQDGDFSSSTLIKIGPAASTGWRIVGVADFNRDSKTDVLWRNMFTGTTRVWHMDGTKITGNSLLRDGLSGGKNWRIAGPK